MTSTVQKREAYINSCFVVGLTISPMNEAQFLLTSSTFGRLHIRKKDNREFEEKVACRKAQHFGLIYR